MILSDESVVIFILVNFQRLQVDFNTDNERDYDDVNVEKLLACIAKMECWWKKCLIRSVLGNLTQRFWLCSSCLATQNRTLRRITG